MRWVVGLLAALPLALAAIEVSAQAGYPDKPIRIMVGFSAGVAPDVTSRLFGDKWNETWAKGVAVENVTGAGGNLAVERALQGAAGRLHAVDGRQRRAGDQSEPDGQARLRSDQGLRLHHPGLHRAEPGGGAARRSGQDHPGADRARQGEAGLFRRGPRRDRHLAASRRRAVHEDDRRQDSAGAVSRHHADPAGPAGRTAQPVLRQHLELPAAGARGQAAGVRASPRASVRRKSPTCPRWKSWVSRISTPPPGSA